MRKSSRLSTHITALLITALVLSQVVVFAQSSVPSSPATESSQVRESSKTKKKKKKRRSKVSSTSPAPFRTVEARSGVAVNSKPAPPETTSLTGTIRTGSRAARTPGVHILPTSTRAVAPLAVFTNPTMIQIDENDTGPNPQPAIPYPSEIEVSGLTGSVSTVSVTINNLTHSSVDDLDMMLVAPGGQALHFWSDVGGANAVSDVTITVADSGATPLPDDGPLVSGTTYQPFNNDTNLDEFPLPALEIFSEPAPAGAATFTSVFGGLTAAQANGTWFLYVTDDIDGGGGLISGGWSLDITEFNPPTTEGQLIISEFRLGGPNGPEDEFIELYNAAGSELRVQSAEESAGLAVAASDGISRCVVPNGTVIPARGHFLCVNSDGYSLGTYPAGDGTTATGDLIYTTDIPDNAGIAIFNNSTGGASFSLANRIDAVGSTNEANTLYREGTGYSPLLVTSSQHSFYRDMCGKGGSTTVLGQCPTGGAPKDTNNNAADFIFVDTNGTDGDAQQLGAPGPENSTSPTQHNASVLATLAVPCIAASAAPNRVRDFTSDEANNSTFGTLAIRRQFTNLTNQNVSRLRFRIIDISTFPAPAGIADLRARTSSNVIEPNPACNGGGTINFIGTTLEEGANIQPNGGAFNSSLGISTITLATPLPVNASINITFLLGIQQTGTFKFYINVEALESAPIPDELGRTGAKRAGQ